MINISTAKHKLLLHKMASFSPSLTKEISAQIQNSETEIIDDFGSLKITVTSGETLDVQDGPIVNATCNDQDTIDGYGPYVNFILFVKNGYINELQIYKDDGTEIKNKVNPCNLKSL